MAIYPIRFHVFMYDGRDDVCCRGCGKPFKDGEEVWCVGQGHYGRRKYECDECFEKEVLVYYPMRQP